MGVPRDSDAEQEDEERLGPEGTAGISEACAVLRSHVETSSFSIDAASGVVSDPAAARETLKGRLDPGSEAGRGRAALVVEEGRSRTAVPARVARAKAEDLGFSIDVVDMTGPGRSTVTPTVRSTGIAWREPLRRFPRLGRRARLRARPHGRRRSDADRVPPPRGRDRVRSGLSPGRFRLHHCGRRVHSVTSPVGAFLRYPKRCRRRAIHRGAPRRARSRPARVSSETMPGSTRRACSIHDLRSSREASSHGRPTARQRKKPPSRGRVRAQPESGRDLVPGWSARTRPCPRA